MNCAKYAVGESWTCLAQSQRDSGSKEEWEELGPEKTECWYINPLVDNGLLVYSLNYLPAVAAFYTSFIIL